MAALRQVKPQNRVARLQKGEIHRGVRLRTGMRLHVRMFRAKQLLYPINRQLFNLIDDFTAAVVAFSR